MKNAVTTIIAVLSFGILSACSVEVGSKQWCEDMDKKPKGEWTVNEAGDYAKHCVFRDDD